MIGTYTTDSTFTIVHARHLASKVAADLHLCALYYGKPSESSIVDYTDELATLLRNGYLSKYEFGFERDGRRVVCWRYIVYSDGSIETDDAAGKLCSYAVAARAIYYNFLSYSSKWFDLSPAERERIKSSLPIQRTSGSLPSDGDGYWTRDRSYCSNGVGLARSTFRPSMS